MPIDNTGMTVGEIDLIAMATQSRKITNRNSPVPMDRIQPGVFQYALSRAKKFGSPMQGGYRFLVKGNRGQKLQWWQGADILTFENRQNLSDMVFDIGMGHMGWELIYDTIKRAGIPVSYTSDIREGGVSPKAYEVACNIVESTFDDIEYDIMLDMSKRFLTSNSDAAKCFTGRHGLIDPTTNSTGTIGKRSRTSRPFQHQLITGVTADTIMKSFFTMIQRANRRAGGTKIDYISCGDTAFGLLVDLFQGNSTTAGKFDYRAAREYAQKKGEKFNIAMPQNCFAYEDTLIVNDPIYQELALEYPANAYDFGKVIDFWNFSHFGIMPVVPEADITHPLPYNQRVARGSKHVEYVEWCDLPSSQGVMLVA